MSLLSDMNEREKRILLVGSICGILLLVYSLILEPIITHKNRLERGLSKQQQYVVWMEAAVAQIEQFQSNGESASLPDGESLSTVIDETIKDSTRLKKAMQRLQPIGNNRVRVWFEEVEFDRAIKWLGTLADSYGITVDNISIEPLSSGKGNVNIKVALVSSF